MKKVRSYQKWFLAISVLIIVDLSLGQVAKEFIPGSVHQREQERKHRKRSDIYHHDLKKLVSSNAYWGNKKVAFFTNSLGFRDRSARRIPLRSESYRLVFIGDSFTEGVGVEYDESFVGVIDRELSFCNIETLNAAVVSYSPSIYYRKVRYLIEEVGLKFNELIVFLDISDIEDEAIYYDFDAVGNVVDSPSSPVINTFTEKQRKRVEKRKLLKTRLKENSVILRVIDGIKDNFLNDREPAAQNANGVWSPVGLERSSWTFDDEIYRRYGKRGLEKAERGMDLLAKTLDAAGADLTLVVYPWPDQIAAQDSPSRQVTWWRKWSMENNVRFIDLFPVFINSREPASVIDRYFIQGDVHFNIAGHRQVAEAFLQARTDLRSRCES